MKVNLDRTSSGFCIGVQGTIHVAEEKLRDPQGLFSLGDVVHNEAEVKRLEALGLVTIDEPTFRNLKNARVLIRAHGEPPATYSAAEENNLEITDTTCPVVSRLQRTTRALHELGYQIIIYGKPTHPEVIGINGQCANSAIIIKHADLSDPEETKALDAAKKTALISQTTMDVPGFYELKANLEARFAPVASTPPTPWMAIRDIDITAEVTGVRSMPRHIFKDTICRQVSSRNRKLHDFALANEVIIFVAGKKSSNGQVLYNICRDANPRSYFIEDVEEIQPEWLVSLNGSGVASAGICGATSTPMWLLEKVANYIESNFS
ncbi:4-hydroxy-3-methylbut-2-enyl diphosphate reductase [Chlorobium sp. BLA1]|uniref:4-hydroxy-3-methylbut-2-enyl diphosphate reductase n=1 Tax=Candidatus Chlorobium masyuteum TaxID=2716876 RepID=UPI00141EECF5|nr:4-hydroxy-3-methylbut-2-enyl diphosphate reductase [Candidatus Chlorobium masyuteum]NHQ59326.1 4-hydroxy-3-methylbut-2-enyl diphosphate reductase [Candidatus Chlorobium masyuteum]NTU45101.1 4-hydroxy-3-methylbut-2-enyl diphosphate reductase [Chlorobiaceae bacterium]